ncbi:D-glucuronyl C5-epimerase B [Neocloeon triangulifer]|uniref:D-glucuronyl C5-epimerase B n=1 Tax=Neocloeon triangulifer TaxID=2078957 RepID=UPI00286F2532|nr:D-glucuronyl C5-epimerase B [Neocloeon triangulifer]
MARATLKQLLSVVVVGVLLLAGLWSQCGPTPITRAPQPLQVAYKDIECQINGEYSVACLRQEEQVWLPFSFVHKYFEVYGELGQSADGSERFDFWHATAKVYKPKADYDPQGVFLFFDNYNVEVRDRVKCVSADEGVPISTQWDPSGYYYPTQVAQFGLAHYSKNLTQPLPTRQTLEDGGDSASAKWISASSSSFKRISDSERQSKVLLFTGRLHTVTAADLPYLDVDVLFKANSSLWVAVEQKGQPTRRIHYVCGQDRPVWADGRDAFYGMGSCGRWIRLSRDLALDLHKAIRTPRRPRGLQVVAIGLDGEGRLDDLSIASGSNHGALFWASAQWFVRHQTSEGGWQIPVRRRLAAGMSVLAPGWLSAMAQGHAASILARAYLRSGDKKYLTAAENGLRPFRVASARGGVRTSLWGHPWFEEYPTSPPSLVLNGFIYALLGLHDLRVIGRSKEAAALYAEGLASLRALLPLYDMGSGSVYDLRHVTVGCAPNVARWDYHATHVNQLLLLATVEPAEELLARTANRWANYMLGHRAAHN